MKITAIHTSEVGPVDDGVISLINDWSEEVEEKVLFTGPNGCGKSTLLCAIAMLWEAAGHWLDRRKTLPSKHAARVWLNDWRGVAVVFDSIEPFYQQPIGCFWKRGMVQGIKKRIS